MRSSSYTQPPTSKKHGPLGVAVPAADPSADAWTGPVVRLDDLTDAERIALGGRACTDPLYRPASVGITPCPICTHWRDESPAVRCSTCGVFSLTRLGPIEETQR